MVNVYVCVGRARKPAHPLGGGRRIMMAVAANSVPPRWQLGPAGCVDMLVLEPVKDKSQLLRQVPPPPRHGGLIVLTSKWPDKVP